MPPQLAIMNPWESSALDYQFNGTPQPDAATQWTKKSTTTDHLIYPGLYCPSGLDIMTILFRIMARPNPTVSLGPIDCSVALIVCDLTLPDTPIVYASDPFFHMTGYCAKDIMGKNCRFLQAPGGMVLSKSARKHVDKETIKKMRTAIDSNTEVQTEVTNFKKDGKPFVNLLTIIPIPWDSAEYRYSVGFQCEKV